MFSMAPLTDEEGDEVISIASNMLTAMQTRIDAFCREHGRGDPREADLLLVMISETFLTGMLITTAPEEFRVPVMRKISHNVIETLRARMKTEVRGHA
jgi:hypothetical protein